jgi:hypothetical protein
MQDVRDNFNRLIATFQENGSTIWMRNGLGQQVGRYEKHVNITYTAGGKMIGYGNQLMCLVTR